LIDTVSDGSDVNGELKCLFVRDSLLIRRFWWCSVEVRCRLFKTFCMFFIWCWSVEILQSHLCKNFLLRMWSVQRLSLGAINTVVFLICWWIWACPALILWLFMLILSAIQDWSHLLIA